MTKRSRVFHSFLILVVSFAIIFGLPQSVAAIFIPVTGYETPTAVEENIIPSLQDFTISLGTGNTGELVGVYVDQAFAYPVVQQPANSPAFVSTEDGVLTQFSLAGQYGSTGLLAHNYLAGESFDQLQESQQVSLVFGDGSIQEYMITDVRVFKATNPYSAYSNFEDLESHTILSSTDLFMETYAVEGALIFQTCLEKDGVDSWGRVFVIAEPVENSILDM